MQSSHEVHAYHRMLSNNLQPWMFVGKCPTATASSWVWSWHSKQTPPTPQHINFPDFFHSTVSTSHFFGKAKRKKKLYSKISRKITINCPSLFSACANFRLARCCCASWDHFCEWNEWDRNQQKKREAFTELWNGIFQYVIRKDPIKTSSKTLNWCWLPSGSSGWRLCKTGEHMLHTWKPWTVRT